MVGEGPRLSGLLRRGTGCGRAQGFSSAGLQEGDGVGQTQVQEGLVGRYVGAGGFRLLFSSSPPAPSRPPRAPTQLWRRPASRRPSPARRPRQAGSRTSRRRRRPAR